MMRNWKKESRNFYVSVRKDESFRNCVCRMWAKKKRFETFGDLASVPRHDRNKELIEQ